MSKATTTNQLRQAANRSQGYAAAVAAAAADAIEELETSKAEKRHVITATISAAGWLKDEVTPDPDTESTERVDLPFPYYYDITGQVTADDEADVYIVPDSTAAARECGFSPMTQTLEGKIRVRAQLQPETDILVQCSIMKGVTQ